MLKCNHLMSAGKYTETFKACWEARPLLTLTPWTPQQPEYELQVCSSRSPVKNRHTEEWWEKRSPSTCHLPPKREGTPYGM